MTPGPVPPPSHPPQRGKSAVAIVAIAVVALFACCTLGLIAAIAIPNFLKFNSRAKQAECRANLQSLYAQQAAYFSEKEDYADTFTQLGFAPSGPRRYTYLMGDGEAVLGPTSGIAVSEDLLPAIAGDTLPGVTGTCPDDCEFVAVCAANLDGDPAVDTWSVSSRERVGHDGEPIAAGAVFHDQDDFGR